MLTGNVYHDTQVATGVLEGVTDYYPMSYSDAVDVVNAQVHEYCPRHWDNLVAIGENARGDGCGSVAA